MVSYLTQWLTPGGTLSLVSHCLLIHTNLGTLDLYIYTAMYFVCQHIFSLNICRSQFYELVIHRKEAATYVTDTIYSFHITKWHIWCFFWEIEFTAICFAINLSHHKVIDIRDLLIEVCMHCFAQSIFITLESFKQLSNLNIHNCTKFMCIIL